VCCLPRLKWRGAALQFHSGWNIVFCSGGEILEFAQKSNSCGKGEMSFIEDFFLDRERIRKVLSSKIEGELHIDFAARQALEGSTPIQSEAEKSLKTWMDRYRVLRGKKLSTTVRERLVRAIIKDAPQISRSLLATSILGRHAEIRAYCNTVEGIKIKDEKTGIERDRDFTSLASKLLWLLHPETVPIFDSQAWCATTVIARISGKVYTLVSLVTPGLILKPYCAFLKLHALCFADLFDRIDAIVAAEFSAIFASAKRKNKTITEANAKSQYANHMTVIDQILWHLGSSVAVDECIAKRANKKQQQQ
jgi:hypothetical protein